MKQVEFKVREVNRNEFLSQLEAYGAEITFTGEISTVYYDNKDIGFADSGKRLCLRSKGQETMLTFKNKYSDLEVSISDEYEISISDPLTMEKVLEGMGYEPLVKFQKDRVDLKIDDVYFSFDKYRGEYSFIPEFLTIESNNEAIILYWADELGIKRENLESITVLGLIKMYQDAKNYEANMHML